MCRLFFILLLSAAAALVWTPRLARAEGPSPRRVFALVVTSNKSHKLTRPDLRYADDDGARYYELFRTMAPDANVTLLTSFDRDTAKQFPELASKALPPEKMRVVSAFRDLAGKVREAAANNEATDFYFVFAGHGDVDGGKGFVELADAKLVSDELTSLVASVPATRSHVILDSCNSFFVLNARKPGGKRFATAAEAGERLNRTLPHVGVFLSTSAEAETFEWSELAAGIFSHAVRSGLAGAADANADGAVSYDELAAFVYTATKEVKNPRFRPSVFARGPRGVGGEPLLRLAAAASARLALPQNAGRVTLRDADDVPWIDAHFEPGVSAALYLPAPTATGSVTMASGRHPVERGDDGLVLGEPSANAALASRGAGEIFRNLFARPFGPRALAQYREEVGSSPPPVYGVANEDVVRMNELLWHASENARSDRKLRALAFGGIAGVNAGLATYELSQDRSPVVLYSVAGVSLAISGWFLLRSSREERALEWFDRHRAKMASSPELMLEAEERLIALAKYDRTERLVWRWTGIGLGGSVVGLFSALSVMAAVDGNSATAVNGGAAALLMGVGLAIPVIGTFTPTYTERMAEIWSRDPSRVQSRAASSSFSMRPTLGGAPGAGAAVGLSGTF